MSAKQRPTGLMAEGIQRWIMLGVLVVVAVGAGVGYWRATTSRNPILLSPEEDTFVSYWNCAENLVNGMTQVRSNEEFLKPPRGAIPVAEDEEPESLKEILDRVCADLEAYREKLLQLPDEEIETLTGVHAKLVQSVVGAREDLARRLKDPTQIFGEDWDRYWQALHVDSAESN